jgi:site-specific recombinase XerD
MITSLKKCFKELKINSLKSIDMDSGYEIIKYFKENTDKSNDTINKHLNYLKNILQYFNIKTNFIKYPKLKTDSKSFKRFYTDDLSLIITYLASLNDSKNSLVYKTLVYFLLDSGVRISELLSIKIRNIDHSSSPNRIFIENTKNGKVRYAPFSEFSKPYILELISIDPDREYLFINIIKSRLLSKNDVRLFYRRLQDKLNIDRIHSHRFRKTFASLLIENGMSIYDLSDLLDHSRISTTQIYTQSKQTRSMKEYSKFNHWHIKKGLD